MTRPRADIDVWLELWATQCRSIDVNIGYPKVVPFYEPPLHYSDDFDPSDPDYYDWAQAIKIHRVYPGVYRQDEIAATCVRELYGAYPAASGSRKIRVSALASKLGVKKRVIYMQCEVGRILILGGLAAIG